MLDPEQQDYLIPIQIRVRGTSYDAAAAEVLQRMQELLQVPIVGETPGLDEIIDAEFTEL